MNYLEKIEAVKLKFINLGYPELADKILELQLSGGTGGEVLISVCSELLKIKREHYKVYSYIEDEATALIKYANSIGLFPEG
jgi:hypothetical protein